MAFPDTPLGVVTKLGIGGVMTDVTEHALTRSIITHTRGQTSEGQVADPASCSLSLKSPNGLYSPRNPRSPYFKKIGLNTPMEVSLRAGSPGMEVAGQVGDYASTPDVAALDITGDIDIRVDATLFNWVDGTPVGLDTVELLAKLAVAAGSKSWFFATRNDRLYFEWSADGTNVLSASSTVLFPLPASGHAAVRVTLDVDNGAGGNTVTFYTAPSGVSGPWTQLGDPIVGSGTTSIFNSATDVRLGDASAVPFMRPVGRFHRAEIRNGIGGTVVASPDFTAQPVGTTSFVDSAGRTWTLNGTSVITDNQVRFVGEFSDWPAEWSPRGDLITVDGNGAGILERMNQGTKVLASTLRRRIPSYSPVAYWPLEEGADATTAFSPIAEVSAFTPVGLDFAADDSLPGSSPLPVVQVGASFVAKVPPVAAGTWQVELVYNLDAMPAALTTLFEVRTTGTARRVRARVATNQVTIEGLDAEDATVFTATTTAPQFTGAWNRLQIKAVQSGGNVQYVFRWVAIGGGGFSVNTTIAAVPGYVIDIRSSFGTGLDGMRFGHLAVFNSETDTPFNSADQGFNGETAGARMIRLCQEEGVTFRFAGVVSETMQMGPQRPGTLLSLLQDCAEADAGIFGEDRARLGLRYRARTSLYNQEPRLALQYGAPGLARPLVPVDDTQSVRNDITVERVAGGSARAVLQEGRLSVQDPPDGVGLYDEGVGLNLYSDALTEPSAYWRLHLGTWDEARYPVVTVRLHKAPHLIPAILDLTEGDLIRITDLPDWLPPGPVDLLVQGYTERLGVFTWEIDLVCVPAGPYRVGALEDIALDWVDTDGSELAAAATDTATTLDVLTTAGLVWKPDPAETPFDLIVGGEEVRVTAGGRLLNSNPFFDEGIAGWSAQGSTVAPSTAVLHPQAIGSMLVTPNGVAADANAVGDMTAVGSIVPGASYLVSMWAYSPGGYSDIRPGVNWHTAAGTFISTSAGSTPMPVPAGVWTFLKQTVTAPSTASRAAMLTLERGTPAAGAVYYAWAVRITRPEASWLKDSFSRTSASGWGQSDSGLTWSTVGLGSATDYTVGSGYATHLLATLDAARRTAVTAVHPDWDLYCDVTTSALATGDSLFGGPTARMVDGSNMYQCRAEFTTGNAIVVSIRKILAGVNTAVGATYTVPVTHVAGQMIRVRFQGRGSSLKAKAWLASAAEPDLWQIEGTDTSLTAAAQFGTRSIRVTGNTNLATVEVRYDNFEVVNPQTLFVDRARNGVVKPQAAGEDVRLAYPTIVAL
ncbi:MAG: hypothetical protein HOV70_19975 [Streptomyces sp.]|nr:hypothetical protein [Streptomyces sp.]